MINGPLGSKSVRDENPPPHVRDWMGDWLVERFTLLGVTFQNCMIVALAIVLVGGLLAWWRQR